MDNARVREIQQIDERTLGITWTDGRASKYDVVSLRRACPCATCIDEWTREKRLKPSDVPESVRPVRIESVGSYALKVQFSDGHSTGIYTFHMLRQLS
jgi:DUF971 family protein